LVNRPDLHHSAYLLEHFSRESGNRSFQGSDVGRATG
jgi:hypothetical protein